MFHRKWRSPCDVPRPGISNLLDARGYRWLLRELGEVLKSPRAMIRAAVAAGAIVLVEHPPESVLESAEAAGCLAATYRLVGVSLDRVQPGQGRQPYRPLGLRQSSPPKHHHQAEITPFESARLSGGPGRSSETNRRGTQQLDIAPELIRLFERSLGGSLRERKA